MILRAFLLVLLALIAVCTPVQAQYRWVDKNGKVQFTDTPPPPGAKDVRKQRSYAPSTGDSDAVPFAVARAQKDFPVTLYSSPVCKNPCDMARALLNKRGVPFAEISVWDEASREKLKRVAGETDEVPVLRAKRFPGGVIR